MPLTSMHPPSSSGASGGASASNHNSSHHAHSAYPAHSQHSSQAAPLAAAVAAGAHSSTGSGSQLPPTLVVNLPPPLPKDPLTPFDPPPPYPGMPKPSAPPLTLIAPPSAAGVSNGGPPSHGWRHNRQGQANVPISAKSTSSSSSSSSSKPPKKGDHHHHEASKGRRSWFRFTLDGHLSITSRPHLSSWLCYYYNYHHKHTPKCCRPCLLISFFFHSFARSSFFSFIILSTFLGYFFFFNCHVSLHFLTNLFPLTHTQVKILYISLSFLCKVHHAQLTPKDCTDTKIVTQIHFDVFSLDALIELSELPVSVY